VVVTSCGGNSKEIALLWFQVADRTIRTLE
jgi:hypothetical protein